MCPYVGAIQKFIDRRQFCFLSILYIYDMRSAVTMSQSPLSPSTTPLNATRSRPRRLAPDPLGRGQYENGTKHPLIVCCDGKYNAQRRGPATLAAQVHKACWDYVACDRFAYPLVKENSISHFPAETRFQTSEPHIPGRLPSLGPALDVGYLQLVICRKGGK